MSRSPKTTIAAVRGIGVAVITSTSGSAPAPDAASLPFRTAAPHAAPRRTGAARRYDRDPERRETARRLSRGRGCRRRGRQIRLPDPRPDPLLSAAGVRLVRRATATGRLPPSAIRVRHLETFEHRLDGDEVLLGEDLGGRHEGPLVATLDTREQAHRPRRRSFRIRRPPGAAGSSAAGPARSRSISSDRLVVGPSVSSNSRPSQELLHQIGSIPLAVRSSCLMPRASARASCRRITTSSCSLSSSSKASRRLAAPCLAERRGVVDARRRPRSARRGRARSRTSSGAGREAASPCQRASPTHSPYSQPAMPEASVVG